MIKKIIRNINLDKINEIKSISFVKDVSILQVGSMAGTLLSALTSVVFARVLGPALYGTYSLIFAFAGLAGLFMSWGSSYGGLTLFVEAYARKDKIKIMEVIVYFFRISLIAAIIVSLLSMFLAAPITKIIYGNAHIGNLARWIILLSIIEVFYSLIIIILQGIRKIKYLTILENINKFLSALIPITFVLMGMGLAGIVLGQVITAIIFFIFSISLYVIFSNRNKLFPQPKDIIINFFKVKIKKYFTFGFSIAIDKNIAGLCTLLPTIIAGSFITTNEIAFFKVAVGLTTMSLIILSPVSRLLNVQFPKSKTQGISQLRKIFYRTTKWSLLISVLIAICLIIFSKFVIILFYGKEFAFSAHLVYLMSLLAAISGIGVVLGPIYRTLNKMKITIILNTILVLIGLPIFYLIIKNYGIWGLTISYIAWQGLSNVLGFFIIARIIDKLNDEEITKSSLV
jgi:O-antigen/teichoic acid export membrane protein